MPRELILREVRQPIIRAYEDGPVAEGSVRVRITAGAPKHGTEMQFFRGEVAVEFPRRLGNICVGTIAEVGPGVTGYAVGDRVAGYGGLRETHTWPADRVLRMNDRMTWQEAVCFDPAQFAFSGVRDSQLRVGDRAAVFGLGAIGQMAVQLARLAGAAFVAAVDPVARRRDAAASVGADLVIDPTAENAGDALKKATGNRGIDVAIETSGNYSALHEAIHGLAWGGNVAFVGFAKECTGGLNFGTDAHFMVPNIIFSRACSEPNRDHPRWDWPRIKEACWQLLADGRLQCEPIIHPVVPFSESIEAFGDIDQHPDRSIKLGVLVGEGEGEQVTE